MTPKELQEIDPFTQLILLRLFAGVDLAKVRKDVVKLTGLNGAEGNARFDEKWSALVEREWIKLNEVPGKTKRAKPKVTHDFTSVGRSAFLAHLDLASIPDKVTWAKLQADYLWPIVLGIEPGTKQAASLTKGFAQALIARWRSLPLDSTATSKQVVSALAWKLAGIECNAPFSAEAFILKTLLPGRPGKVLSTVQLQSVLAAMAVSARGGKTTDLKSAALRNWLADVDAAASLKEAASPAKTATISEPVTLKRFAELALEAARRAPNGRFGEHKVFISHAWRQYPSVAASDAMEFPEFKRKLIGAQQARLLHLSRADLVEAMNPTDVQESQTEHLNATFHFIRI